MTETMYKVFAVAVYGGILLLIGYLASRGMKSIRDYFAGGKNMGFLSVAFSARATGESAWLLLGLTGMGYAVGASAFWVVAGEILGVTGSWLVMARRFKRFTDRYDSITVPDYLESRLRDNGHVLRLIAAATLSIFVTIYAATQVHASGQAFFSFLGVPHWIGATVGFAIVLVYITQGGFKAVVWSDVFQGSLMLLGLVALPLVAMLELGGITNLTDALRAQDPALLTAHGPVNAAGTNAGWNLYAVTGVVGLLAIGLGYWGSPQLFVRYIAIRSEKELLPGAAIAIVWTILGGCGAVLIGMTGRALFSTEVDALGSQDNVLAVMAESLLHPFFTGLFIAMVLSAIMSTIDSLLVVASSAAARDFWQKSMNPGMTDEALMKLSRGITVALSLVAFAIGMGIILYDAKQGVFWTIIFGWSGIAASFCPVMILSLFWRKLTALGAKCAMVAGFFAVPGLKFGAPWIFGALGWDAATAVLANLDVLAPAFAISFAVAIGVSLLDPKGPPEGVDDDFAYAKAKFEPTKTPE